MYESWTNKESDVGLSGYVSHNFYRKFQNRNAKRCNGGVVLYYKEHLKKGIEIIRTPYDTVIWLKLDRLFFHFDKDVYICGTYIWCEDSPAYNIATVDLFDTIQNDIHDFEELGSLYLVGDWNSRVGVKHDFINCDMFNRQTDDNDYIPDRPLDRASMDKICNNFGVKVLDLCKSTCLRIANGRLFRDNCGMFTFANALGASVIDLLLSKERDFSLLCDFCIDSFNEFSDHAGVLFSLKCDVYVEMSESKSEVKYKWNEEHKCDFRSRLITKLPHFNHLTNHINVDSRGTVNNLLNNFTDIVCEVANPLFSKSCSFNSKRSHFNDRPITNHAEWFDAECTQARNKYLDALSVFNRLKSSYCREQFCNYKKVYKDLCRKKRNLFECRKLDEIGQLKHAKPSSFGNMLNVKSHL